MKLFKNINTFFLVLSLPLGLMISSCESDDTAVIEHSEVTAEFSGSPTDVETGQVVSFMDESTGDVTHWSWSFEGGTPERSSLQNPEVTYASDGTYEVKLVVSNAKHTGVETKVDYINVTRAPEPVTAEFTTDKVSLQMGETVVFTDASEGFPTEWSWEFTSEGVTTITSTEQNPEIEFIEPGIYNVKLYAANSAYSDEIIKTEIITVVDPSTVAASFTTDKSVAVAGEEITFMSTSVGEIESFSWTFEGGVPATSNEENPVVIFDTFGNHNVTLEVSNGVQSSTAESVIKVIPGSGLLAFLPLNGNANDLGPFGFNVTNSGVIFNGRDRKNTPDATAVFDGSSYLRIEPHENKQFGTSSYSVGVWLKTEQPSRMMIWEEGGGGAGLPQAWLRINDDASDRLIRFNVNTGPILNVGINDGIAALSDGEWHYVMAVRDAAGLAKVYVDGNLVKENNSADIKDLANDLGFIIGAMDNGPGIIDNNFTGQLDDLVIYNRALTEEEILQLSE